jgi:acyl carrier protein
MSQDEIISELEPIFQDVLDQPSLKLTGESNASNVEGWDSLAHVTLVGAVERKFRVRFTLAELQSLKNIGDMASVIGKKTAK